MTKSLLLYGLAILAGAMTPLSFLIGTLRKLFVRRRPLRLSRGLVYELLKWASLIVVIALGFIGMAYLIIVLT